MLKVEFKKGDNLDKFPEYKLVIINDVIDENSFYIDHDYRSAYFYNENVLNILYDSTIRDISKFFDKISHGVEEDWWEKDIGVDVNLNLRKYIDHICVKLTLYIDTDLWSAGWSLKKFSETLRDTIDQFQIDAAIHFEEDPDTVSNGFGLIYKIENLDNELSIYVHEALDILERAVKITNECLSMGMNENSLVSVFDFPEEIKVPCQQYLMYFAQFLKDLGIEADTEIKEQVKGTLLKITPKDKDEALDQIKEALEIYIKTPELQDAQIQTLNNGDISFIQLQANVMHLKSQIMFAQSSLQMKDAAIQMKDVTIEALQLSNYQLKNLLQTQTIKPKEEVEVIPGAVTLKKYEGNGFSINLPEIFKNLKRRFR